MAEMSDLFSGQPLARRQSLWQQLHLDPVLCLLLLLLSGGGLIVLYSGSGQSLEMVTRQASYLSIGFVAMLVLAQFSPRFLARWSLLGYLGVAVMLALVLLLGDSAKGAQRWLELPGVPRFQPSEFMKLAMPLTVAAYMARQTLPPTFKTIIIGLTLVVAPSFLILEQPDLGTTLLVAASGLFVILLAGLSWKLIAGAGVLAAPAGWVMWNFVMRPYQRERVLTMLDPESDPWGAGWNIIQSKVAIGSGGFEGKGWLLGTQSHLDFLPESHTDFILAVLAEEFGLIGVLTLLLVYALIIGRGLYLASHAQSLFGRLAGGSIMLTFFVYLFVNIGMVSGILPVVGVPLPLVSRGGTSIVTLMAGFGILMSVYSHRRMHSAG